LLTADIDCEGGYATLPLPSPPVLVVLVVYSSLLGPIEGGGGGEGAFPSCQAAEPKERGRIYVSRERSLRHPRRRRRRRRVDVHGLQTLTLCFLASNNPFSSPPAPPMTPELSGFFRSKLGRQADNGGLFSSALFACWSSRHDSHSWKASRRPSANARRPSPPLRCKHCRRPRYRLRDNGQEGSSS